MPNDKEYIYNPADYDTLANQVVRPKVNLPQPQLDSPVILNTNVSGGYSSTEDAYNKLLSVRANLGKGYSNTSAYTAINPQAIDTSGRYPMQVLGGDNEDIYGQAQNNWKKAGNGLLKGIGLGLTTFTSGTVGLVNGVYDAIADKKFSKIWDNETTREMDSINSSLENSLPNYYSNAESSAAWYSPQRWGTINFIFDKFIKNLGFVAGAAYSGAVWSKALTLIPAAARAAGAGKLLNITTEAENAALTAANAGEASKSLGLLSRSVNQFNNIFKTETFAHKAIISGLGSMGEASMEAIGNSNQFRQEQIDKYTKEHGYAPEGQDLDKINELTESVGNANFGLNMALLTATNYIQLPRLIGGSAKADRIALQSVGGETNAIRRLADGTYEAIRPTTTLGKISQFVKDKSGYIFAGSEAFEEGAQNAINVGVNNYYSKKNGKDGGSFLDSLYEGVRSTLTTNEGMEAILLGGVSGGISMAGGRSKERSQVTNNTNNLLANLNGYSPQDYLKSHAEAVSRGINLQVDIENALKSGDTLEVKDLQADYAVNYLSSRVKYGRGDLVRQELGDYRTLASTEEGFSELQTQGIASPNDTREAFLNRINDTENTLNSLEKTYKNVYSRYGNQKVLNQETGEYERLYTEPVLDKMAYASAKIMDYDKRLKQLQQSAMSSNASVEQFNKVIDTASKDEKEGLRESYDDYASSLDQTVLPDVKDDLLEEAKDAVEISLRRKKFLQDYTELRDDPTNFSDETEEENAIPEEGNETDEAQSQPLISIGEKEIVPTTTYTVGNTQKRNEDGTFTSNPNTIQVIGENEDGTIKAQDENGNVKNYTKEEINSLGLVSPDNNSTNANFYKANVGQEYDLVEGGRQHRGVLKYDENSDELTFNYTVNGEQHSIPVTKELLNDTNGELLYPVSNYDDVRSQALSDFTQNSTTNISYSWFDKLNELLNSYSERINSIGDKIAKKQSQLDELQKKINKVQNKPRSSKASIREASKFVSSLISFRESLEEDIQNLQAQQDTLQFNHDYLSRQIENNVLTSNETVRNRLYSQLDNIDKTLENGVGEIKRLTTFRDKVNNSIDKAVDYLRHLVSLFERTYPKAPTAIGRELVDFLKSNPNFLRYNPNYKQDLEEVERIIAEVEDTEITPNENRLKELNKSLNDLYDQMNEYSSNLQSTKDVLEDAINAIESGMSEVNEEIRTATEVVQENNKEEPIVVTPESQQDAQEEDLKEAQEQEGSVVPPSGESINVDNTSRDTAKKHGSQLFDATTSNTKSQKTNSDQKRHARFLNWIFGNKSPNIRAIKVTANNEEALGLKGITERHLNGYEASQDPSKQLILRVYVKQMPDGSYQYIDERGVTIGPVPETGGIPELQQQYNNAKNASVNLTKKINQFLLNSSDYFRSLPNDEKDIYQKTIDYLDSNNKLETVARFVNGDTNLQEFEQEMGGKIINVDGELQHGLISLSNLFKKYAFGEGKEALANWKESYEQVRNVPQENKTTVQNNTNLSEGVSLDRVIWGVMPTNSLTFSSDYGNETRYQGISETEAEELAVRYTQAREQTLSHRESYEIEDFEVSKGILNTDGVSKPLTTSLVNEDRLSKEQVIHKTSKESRRGESLYIKTDNGEEVAPDVRRLNSKEVNNVLEIVKRISNDIKELPKYARYLSGVIKVTSTSDPKRNGIFFDEHNKTLEIGKLKIPYTSIETRSNEIRQQIENIGMNINPTLLKDMTPFTEIVQTKEDGNDTTKTYPNYQSYLISPNGRQVSEIPLTTKVALGDEMYLNRYSYNTNLYDNVEPEVVYLNNTRPIRLDDNDNPVDDFEC